MSDAPPPFEFGKSRYDQKEFQPDYRSSRSEIINSIREFDQSLAIPDRVQESKEMNTQLKKIKPTVNSTFSGRLRHFLNVIDPRTLLTSKSELQEAIRLLDDRKNGLSAPGVTDEDLWRAQKIKQAIIHPDTGEKIFAPFRMSGFVPFGTPIVVGLLLPNLTLPQTVFWQWLNQSHNACVNYANRNASKPTPVSRFIMGYTGAVTSAIGIALGLTVVLRRMNSLRPGLRMVLQRFVPLPAVATASVCNVVLMRNSELAEGIDVLDSTDNVVGTSTIAAKKALTETALTRAFLPVPVLLLPPVVMMLLEKTRWLRSNPRMALPAQAVATTLAFGGALPIAIALFPQVSTISTTEVEPEIREKTSEKVLFYNKGL